MWQKFDHQSARDRDRNYSADTKESTSEHPVVAVQPQQAVLKKSDISEDSSTTVTCPSIVGQSAQLTEFFAKIRTTESADSPKDIGDLFSSSFEYVLQKSNNLKINNCSQTHVIHSLSTLDELIAEKIKANEKADFRVVIDGGCVARFARESHNNISAPPHYGLVSSASKNAQCLTAGNLFLSDDYKTLTKISNKSGDFTPSFDSLKWLVAVLIYNEKQLPFVLPDTLEVEHQSNKRCIKTYQWSLVDIKKWLEQTAISHEFMNRLKMQTHDKGWITLATTTTDNVPTISKSPQQLFGKYPDRVELSRNALFPGASLPGSHSVPGSNSKLYTLSAPQISFSTVANYVPTDVLRSNAPAEDNQQRPPHRI